MNDFDLGVRTQALKQLLSWVEQAKIEVAPEAEVANMHCHTFFSFNGYGYSPTALAWLAKKNGYKLIGVVDFDVLDAVDEFLAACDLAGVRGSAGMETRVFIPEFATREINSPGEPGISYYMGIGFTSSRVPGTVVDILAGMKRRAGTRNRGLIERVNAYLAPVQIDYERDVLPLTPSGNATERHITAAYAAVAARMIDDPAAFWSCKLRLPPAQIAAVFDDPVKLEKLIRARLMKRGGVGYVPPDGGSFPTVEKVNELISACGALPCATWLDGTLPGEQDEEELLRLLIDKGVAALNIVPDRNWNIADPEVKKRKLQNLYDVVELAQRLDLPLNIGTEMNAFGLKRIDTFDAPELAPVRQAFIDGAYFIYGHTAAQRALGIGCRSEWARAHFASHSEENAFYTALGRRTPPGEAGLVWLRRIGAGAPQAFLSA